MYHKHQTEGLIVKSFDSGDSNKIVGLFARELGFIYARIQNGRGLYSKLRSGIQDFTLGDFVLIKGSSGWKMTGVQKRTNIFNELKEKKFEFKIINRILNLTKVILNGGSDSRIVFDCLKFFLLKTPDLTREKFKLAEYATVIRILNGMGYLRKEKKLCPVLEDFGLSEETLKVVKTNEILILSMINESFKALDEKMC